MKTNTKLFIVILLIWGCNRDSGSVEEDLQKLQPDIPAITSISPDKWKHGVEVTIKAFNFGITPAKLN